ncbi:MAG: hypothetical protein ACREX9_05850 [Gammaproteobacteria bacterium]
MARIGDFLGPEAKRDFVTRHLVAGQVVYLEVRFPNRTRSKYVVLAGESSPNCLTFVVNSETSEFISSRPDLNISQVEIRAATHAFLERDSKIDCHEVLSLPKEKVIDELMANTTRIKGMISEEVRGNVIAAVKRARTIDHATVERILAALG